MPATVAVSPLCPGSTARSVSGEPAGHDSTAAVDHRRPDRVIPVVTVAG